MPRRYLGYRSETEDNSPESVEPIRCNENSHPVPRGKKKPYRLITVGSKEKKTKRQKIKGALDRKFPSKQSCHDQEDC